MAIPCQTLNNTLINMNILNLLIPLILLCFTGYKVSKHEVTHEFEHILNKLIINFALPCSILLASNKNNLTSLLNIKFSICYLFSIIIPFFIGFLLIKKLIKKSTSESIFAGMNASISNSGLIAIPILFSLFGDKCIGATTAILVVSSMCMPLIISLIEYEKNKKKTKKITSFF
ncbi:MAG: AEC family transporter [Gammaproteobacteria bacterium]|nr:AEC family transporter [Gammaproteobacteria bacterium]